MSIGLSSQEKLDLMRIKQMFHLPDCKLHWFLWSRFVEKDVWCPYCQEIVNLVLEISSIVGNYREMEQFELTEEQESLE